MQKETFDTLKKIFLLKILLRVLEYAMGIMWSVQYTVMYIPGSS